jgi:uncharacterized membrane protein HdeD (DUF308 family)
MKQTPHSLKFSDRHSKFLGVVFLLIGIFLFFQGGVSLYQLYFDPNLMFVFEEGFSPEKGQCWVKFISGISVMLLGIALFLEAGKKSKTN